MDTGPATRDDEKTQVGCYTPFRQTKPGRGTAGRERQFSPTCFIRVPVPLRTFTKI